MKGGRNDLRKSSTRRRASKRRAELGARVRLANPEVTMASGAEAQSCIQALHGAELGGGVQGGGWGGWVGQVGAGRVTRSVAGLVGWWVGWVGGGG